jgi:hypothetical protein
VVDLDLGRVVETLGGAVICETGTATGEVGGAVVVVKVVVAVLGNDVKVALGAVVVVVVVVELERLDLPGQSGWLSFVRLHSAINCARADAVSLSVGAIVVVTGAGTVTVIDCGEPVRVVFALPAWSETENDAAAVSVDVTAPPPAVAVEVAVTVQTVFEV